MISAYFTVPENATFLNYWDRVETNFYRIRNCLSFAGIPRQLALFEPPIDPGALIRAGGRGRDVPAVIAQGAGSLPHYRFQALLDRARGLTNTTTAFGAALLSALEKKDAEDLQMLRTRQERAILVQTGDMKAELVVEGEDQVESLRQAKLAAQGRLSHYTKLLAEGLSPAEVTSMTTMILANVFQTTGSVIRALSGGAHLVPNAGSPFAMTYGGREIGASLGAFAAVADTVAGTLDFASALSGVIAGYERRAQEWTLQQKTAAYEVAQTAAQIAAAEAHVASLKRDVAINTLSIVQNDEMQKVLTQRFTNADLYGWLATRLQAMYFQAYKLALDLAMAAQRAFQYELDSDKTSLDFSYWESGRAGLLAGEGLQLALDQLEHAYTTTNRRRLSVDKVISLWALDPLALLTLQRTGSCNFQFSELLFDYDFPGHYCRKIERLSVTIPAVVGPYQNVHGTLTETGNVILVRPDPASVKYLLGEDVVPSDTALRLNWRSGQQIALSRGIDDNGIACGSARRRALSAVRGHRRAVELAARTAARLEPDRFLDDCRRGHHAALQRPGGRQDIPRHRARDTVDEIRRSGQRGVAATLSGCLDALSQSRKGSAAIDDIPGRHRFAAGEPHRSERRQGLPAVRPDHTVHRAAGRRAGPGRRTSGDPAAHPGQAVGVEPD